jgi:hypothetical protein
LVFGVYKVSVKNNDCLEEFNGRCKINGVIHLFERSILVQGLVKGLHLVANDYLYYKCWSTFPDYQIFAVEFFGPENMKINQTNRLPY